MSGISSFEISGVLFDLDGACVECLLKFFWFFLIKEMWPVLITFFSLNVFGFFGPNMSKSEVPVGFALYVGRAFFHWGGVKIRGLKG